MKALEEPLKQIAVNAGYSGEVVLNEVIKSYKLFNAKIGVFEDPDKSDIIDPAKTVRCALENASSITALFLTTDSISVEEDTKEDK